MTKTESAHLTAQTVLIESAEQVLQLHSAAGVRLAIPDTDALIMVGPADWIAKNVPGVDAMVEGALTDEQIVDVARAAVAARRLSWLGFGKDEHGRYTVPTLSKCHYDFARAIECEVIARLAATTQASTAQGGELAKPSVERSELANCSSQSMIAQASTAQAEPTDISRRLRDCIAQNVVPFPADVLAAADEIERYYGGMMAWKQTAEKKDRDWNEARMARANDRCAALLDAERFRWIEKNCRTEGGGHGFTVFVPVDHEDIGCGIDEAIRSAGDTGSGE